MPDINKNTDFTFRIGLNDNLFDNNFRGEIFTSGSQRYTFGRVGRKYTRCELAGGGKLRVYADGHELPEGELTLTLTVYVPDRSYPDGVREISATKKTGISLVDGESDLAEEPRVDMRLPLEPPMADEPMPEPATPDDAQARKEMRKAQLFATEYPYLCRGIISLGSKPGAVYDNHGYMRIPGSYVEQDGERYRISKAAIKKALEKWYNNITLCKRNDFRYGNKYVEVNYEDSEDYIYVDEPATAVKYYIRIPENELPRYVRFGIDGALEFSEFPFGKTRPMLDPPKAEDISVIYTPYKQSFKLRVIKTGGNFSEYDNSCVDNLQVEVWRRSLVPRRGRRPRYEPPAGGSVVILRKGDYKLKCAPKGQRYRVGHFVKSRSLHLNKNFVFLNVNRVIGTLIRVRRVSKRRHFSPWVYFLVTITNVANNKVSYKITPAKFRE